jgi:cell division protease FtsH
MKNSTIRNVCIWIMIVIGIMFIFGSISPYNKNHSIEKISYSQFIHDVNNNNVKSVLINNKTIIGLLKNNTKFITYSPNVSNLMIENLISHSVIITSKSPQQTHIFTTLFISWFPFILLIAIWFIFIKQMYNGKGGAFSFGKSKAKLNVNNNKITFKDVAGIDEAKDDVYEIIDFLKNSNKYKKIGSKIPSGLLMIGPPGTGKTLLARAIAGEANVPFFLISGSDFVEMFVGVGASRVRDMFEQAKKISPSIIFIDEIDAVGRHRGSGLNGGHDEREQTLNQLLVEMDGFSKNEGVIVIAATNRPDVLDPALLRPGRFDRQVIVSLPDMKGRSEILKVHLKNILLDKNINADIIARGTPGFSGADLANLVNESALIAVKNDKLQVSMHELELAKDKLLMGSERKNLGMTNKEKNIIAYHESGHAIIGILMPEHDPIYKITIVSRGQALGMTVYLPEKDHFNYSKIKLQSMLCSLYGGRVAEELIFGEDYITTGSENDITRATEIARHMVTKWGFSKLGPLMYKKNNNNTLLINNYEYSDKTVYLIDNEIKNILTESYNNARILLSDNIDILHSMAKSLMEKETLDITDINLLIKDKIK